MKKKVLFSLVFVLLLVGLSGCFQEEDTNNNNLAGNIIVEGKDDKDLITFSADQFLYNIETTTDYTNIYVEASSSDYSDDMAMADAFNTYEIDIVGNFGGELQEIGFVGSVGIGMNVPTSGVITVTFINKNDISNKEVYTINVTVIPSTL